MSEFKSWFCPEHGPQSLILWSSNLKDTSYADPWLHDIDEEGVLTFRYSEEDWEDSGPTRWDLACKTCDWKQTRQQGEVFVSQDGIGW